MQVKNWKMLKHLSLKELFDTNDLGISQNHVLRMQINWRYKCTKKFSTNNKKETDNNSNL